jgi:hypothetical protein
VKPATRPIAAVRSHLRKSLTLAAVILPLGAGLAGGCSEPLLGPTDQRSVFDRYDVVRGNYAPQYIEDKFGRRQPNLRGRLEPKN